MNQFGGNWTQIKIEILVDYAKAYLTIMNSKRYWTLMYFDGFAGTGSIVSDKEQDVGITIGAARRIVDIEEPRPFDVYYFVEKSKRKCRLLKASTQDIFPNKKIYIEPKDCNTKIKDMANFLKSDKGKNHKVLAYIDPCGMQLEWDAISELKDLAVDAWILVPTGMGVNRLLTKTGRISEGWLDRLEKFLGLDRATINRYFYKKKQTLFENIEIIEKELDAINKSADLYKERLNEVFKFVSNPYELKNSSNSVMYHLFLVSNNSTAKKIGDDIVKKYKQLL